MEMIYIFYKLKQMKKRQKKWQMELLSLVKSLYHLCVCEQYEQF